MKFFFALLTWIIMAAVLSRGLLMAIHGSIWLLIVGLVAFALMVAKIGCLSHD